MAINDNHTYNPTLWVNNSEPDIDAEHLNKIESALQEHGITLNDLAAAVGQRIMKSQIVNNLLSTDANTVLSGAMGKNLADKDANLQSQITQLNGEMLTHETLSAKIPAKAGYVDVVVSKSLTRVISAMSTSGDGVYIRQVSAIDAKNIRIYTDSNISDRNTFFLVLYL